ncbi:MAG: acyltransferase [Opitutaceae bacterium]|nr:acyltransferase [Opitutaceae bacterium]
MISPQAFIHPNALVDSGVTIGAGTRVWAFAHLVTGVVVGRDCNICDHTFVEGDVRLGDRVTLKCGVFLWNGVTAENDVFIGPGVSFSNEVWPRSKLYAAQPARTRLQTGCSLGTGSTIMPVAVGEWAMVGAGSVVTRDVPDYALVVGQPAKFRSWICCCTRKMDFGEGRDFTCSCGRKFRKNRGKVALVSCDSATQP